MIEFVQLYVVLSWLLVLPVWSLKERKIWFDQSCTSHPDVDVQGLWEIIKRMKVEAQATTDATASLYQYIFKTSANVNHIKTTIGAISESIAAQGQAANTFIYCDNDKRFKEASDQEARGNSKREKKEKVLVDRSFGKRILTEKTKCKLNSFGRRALGATYCDNFYSDEKYCSITLCDDGILYKSKLANRGLNQWQIEGTDFSDTSGQLEDKDTSPIDAWNLLDTVLLHEITHTIHNDNEGASVLMWIDVENGYGWKNIKALDGTRAALNADSLAYFGLGSWLQNAASKGPYSITGEGKVLKRK